MNGKRSSGKRTQTVNIRHFMIMDQAEKGNVTAVHCLNNLMVADCMTKGPQGLKFRKFQQVIMGF